jgi:hypothetical protein
MLRCPMGRAIRPGSTLIPTSFKAAAPRVVTGRLSEKSCMFRTR